MLLNVIYINKERCLVLLVSHQSVCLVALMAATAFDLPSGSCSYPFALILPNR